MKTVLLDKTKHDRNNFNCKIIALNHYFKAMASQQAKKDSTRTFVLEDTTNNSQVIGFYSLTMIPIELDSLSILQKKHPSSTSGGLIARLGVDIKYKEQGFGECLLIDALAKLLGTNDSVALPVIIVEAKGGSKNFYEKYGFTAFEYDESKLFIADVRASLSNL